MDALLYNTTDGGEIEITSEGVTTTDGLETAVYLSLFGAPDTWWGNTLTADTAAQYRGAFAKLRDEVPATPGNLRRLEAAAASDLAGLPADSISVSVSLVGLDRVRVVVQIDETRLEYTENWDAMRPNIGA